MHMILYLLAIISTISTSCNILPSQTVKQAEVQKTFAELSLAEKYAYLSAVLKAQKQVIRNARIARVKSLTEELTHKGDLTVILESGGFQQAKVLRVKWSKVQADSIELLRCKLKNLKTFATVDADDEVVAAGYDFDKLQSEPNSYGYLDCQRVYGRIENGESIIDYGAENNFSYVYFFRPCFKNYTVVVPAATTDTDTKQCGEDKITAATNNQTSLAATDKHALVFRYCQTDARQICSDVVRHTASNPISFNQGVKELPLHLFEQLHALRAKIQQHKDAIYKESKSALEKLIATGEATGEFNFVDGVNASQEQLDKLREGHDAANARRDEKAASIAFYTGILDQKMAERLGHDMSFRGRNCYGEHKERERDFDELMQELKQMNEQYGTDNTTMLQPEDEDAMQQANGFAVGECLVSNALSLGKLVKIEGLTKLDPKISKNISDHHKAVSASKAGAKFGQTEWALAAANFAVDMIPMETSELNRGDGIAAFTDSLNKIFMGEDTFIRSHCKACLDHMAQIRYHYRAIYRLSQELEALSKAIEEELTNKGAVDPHAQ